MNWQEITEQVASTETLSAARLQQELAKLASNKPDIAHELTSYYTRNGKLGNFMQTSMTEVQRKEQLIKPGTLLGVWQTGEVLGSGGMGDVYKAKRSDGLYEQVVALKVIQSSDAQSMQRFELERKRLASLEHSGISRIIDGGVTEDGRSFMVMEYVEGQPIDQYINENQLGRRQVLGLFLDLCAALSHAHSKLILHRDIKTSNVLVDNEGTVRLIDFGIASAVGDGSEETTGPITILYAPPEQLLRQPPVVGSDIFSMGVLLHHLLTGKTPKRNPDGSVTINEEKLADAELSAIVNKAVAFDANDRYSSATLLARDLDAHINLMPVTARNGGSLYKAGKFLRRNLIASVLGSAFVVALSAGLIGSIVLANKATKEAERANQEAERANAEWETADWSMKRSTTLSQLSDARADSYQYVFGIDENQSDLSAKFLEYLANIDAVEKENNPSAYAAKRFVIGKHFLDRNDYRRAREVLEPWIVEGYGNPETLAYGQTILGHAYVEFGMQEQALSLFKKAEQYYIGTPYENTMEHTAMAIQVALLSDDVNETTRVVSMIDALLEIVTNQYNRSYLIGRIHKLQLMQGNFTAAYTALKQQVDMVEAGALGKTASLDTIFLNYASMNIFYRNELFLARKNLDVAREITETRKGESQSLGYIYELEADLSWIDQDYKVALSKNKLALELLEKYAGKSEHYVDVLAKQAIIQADANNFDAASLILQELSALSADVTGVWPELLRLYIRARKEGIASAQQITMDSGFPREAIEKKLVPGYFLKRLQEDGLKL